MPARLTDTERAGIAAALPDWHIPLARDAIVRSFIFADFSAAFGFMARVALLDQLGTPYRELEKQGCLLPVLETGLTYHRPSHFDDRIRITVTLAEKPKARLRLTYKVERGEELLVEGFTVHAFVNREFKAIRPPENIDAAMRKAFSA